MRSCFRVSVEDKPETIALVDEEGCNQGNKVTFAQEANDDDGTSKHKTQKAKRQRFLLCLLGIYWGLGLAIYKAVEGWDPSETSVFLMSIVTGCGYGHLIPSNDTSRLLTSAFMVTGLGLFASLMGQLLDYLMQGEIDFVVTSLKKEKAEDQSHHESRMEEKRRHFMVGLGHLLALLCSAIFFSMFYWGKGFAESVYAATVTVLKLDSLCSMEEVNCSHGYHTSGGGNPLSLTCTVLWYIVTWGTIGHFMVAASKYLGADDEATMTTCKTVTTHRLERMDTDNDGKVMKWEFLRDRLVQGGVCEKEDVDHILENFDALDKDGSGHLTTEDCQKAAANCEAAAAGKVDSAAAATDA